VLKGRSFNPDELAIAFAQVVVSTVPKDYKDPLQLSHEAPRRIPANG